MSKPTQSRCRYLGYCATREYTSPWANHSHKPGDVWATPAASVIVDHLRDYDTPEFNTFYGFIEVTSYISADHACECARKAYNYWLKTYAPKNEPNL
jgi:hypothetical protein